MIEQNECIMNNTSGEIHLKVDWFVTDLLWRYINIYIHICQGRRTPSHQERLYETLWTLSIPCALCQPHKQKLCLHAFFELGPALRRHGSARLKVILHFYVHSNTWWIRGKKSTGPEQLPMAWHTVHALIRNWLFPVSVMMLFTWPCSNAES